MRCKHQWDVYRRTSPGQETAKHECRLVVAHGDYHLCHCGARSTIKEKTRIDLVEKAFDDLLEIVIAIETSRAYHIESGHALPFPVYNVELESLRERINE